nr:hypothetical protein [Tanacetum cinerariifolium]
MALSHSTTSSFTTFLLSGAMLCFLCTLSSMWRYFLSSCSVKEQRISVMSAGVQAEASACFRNISISPNLYSAGKFPPMTQLGCRVPQMALNVEVNLCGLLELNKSDLSELIILDLIRPSTYQLLQNSSGDSGPELSFDKSASPERLFSLARVSLAEAYKPVLSFRCSEGDYTSSLRLNPPLHTVFGFSPYPFNFPTRRLTIEEMLAKFIDEGKREHEEMEIFIKEFRTTNELLLKTQSNLLRVTTRGGKMKSEVTRSKEINETGINKNEPPRFEQDVHEKPHNDALVQILKYAKYLKSILTNKSRLEEACMETMNERLEEACMETMNERCSAVLLNKLPFKEKDPRSFTIPCQVLEKHKEAEDLAAYHLSRFENPHIEEEVFSQVKTYFLEEPYAFKLCMDNIMRRCVAESETLEILVHCHSGPIGRHHSASVTAKKVYESRFYWHGIFKDANEYAKSLMFGDYILWDHFPNLKDGLQNTDSCTPFRLVCEKACHLPIEIEHKAHWVLKQCNMDLTLASEIRPMQLNELAELRDGAYENTRIYKERTKKWYDSRLNGDQDFKVGDQGRFSFKVNGQRLKKYYRGNIDKEYDKVLEFKNGVT